MRVRNHGKYTKMRLKDPRGIARCDYSGLMVQHAELKPQYQYRGQGLVNTFFMVHPRFLDVPNAQDLTPLIYVDPVPLTNARPDNEVDVIIPQVLELDVSGDQNITLTLSQFSNNTFIFNGELTGDVTISIPATFNEFTVLNKTTGSFDLFMQMINYTPSKIVLIRDQTMYLTCDSLNLYINNSN